MAKRGVNLWNENRLHVDATLHPDGTLRFEGHDLTPDNLWGGNEYEYVLTVRPADVPRVVAALDGEPGADVLALLKAHARLVVGKGESRFLKSCGIEYGFWSRVGD
jgi:hypothetical protein